MYISTTMEIWETTEAQREHWLIYLSNNFLFSVIMVFGIIYIITCMICQLFIVCKLYMKINDMLKWKKRNAQIILFKLTELMHGRHKYTKNVHVHRWWIPVNLYFLMPNSVLWYHACSAVYVYCDYSHSLCVLRLMVQFMCTVSICAVYGYYRIFIQCMATVLCNAVYEYCLSDTIRGQSLF